MSLKPIKRLEMILDGQDIEPATRLEYFLKNASTGVPKPTSADAGKVITVNQDGDGYVLAEGGGGGGLVEIKNVEPFQVPDLVNGGTRLFDPESDELWITTDQDAQYQQIEDPFFITNQNLPGIVDVIVGPGRSIGITTSWYEASAYERSGVSFPKFCVKPSMFYTFEGVSFTGHIFKPDTIVYKYTSPIGG